MWLRRLRRPPVVHVGSSVLIAVRPGIQVELVLTTISWDAGGWSARLESPREEWKL